ncbi:MAG: SDR family NAD(P)-dependent oxidoreductase [Solirubrobacteraceae bacterium]
MVDDLRGRSVLVTGAGGFIGSHLTRALVRSGARVRGLCRYNAYESQGALEWLEPDVRAEVDVVMGDVRDGESVQQAIRGCDAVCHLAAHVGIPYSYANPRGFFETNVLGSLNVARGALDAGATRVVHTSTSEVYGSAQRLPMTEDHPLEAQSPYAASKIGADKLMESFHRSFGLPVVILRPFNTFGPHQSARAIVPTIVSQALAGPTVRVGSLWPRRDLTFVDDTVAGFAAALDAPEAVGRTIQLGTGRDHSVGELVELVGRLLDKELEVEQEVARMRPPDSEVDRLLSSPDRARAVLGWWPTVSLEDGLSMTIDWMRDHAERFSTRHFVV